MTGKEYLGYIQKIEILLRQKQRELYALSERRTLIKGQDYSIEKVQTSPDGSGFTRDSDKQIDMSQELADDIAAFETIRYEVFNQIQSLSDINFVDILYLRYLEGQTFKEIADIKGCSMSTVYHIHTEALKELEERYSGVFCKTLQHFVKAFPK